MDLRHGLLVIGSALALASLGAGSGNAERSPERRLQPFAGVVAGRYVHAGHLQGAAAMRGGGDRVRRFAEAREVGLEALIVRPRVQRGAYRDVGAVRSAW